MTLSLTIKSWTIPDEGWLRINVSLSPVPMTEAFYRVKDPAIEPSSLRLSKPETWDWFQWSMAGKPTVKVHREAAAVLDALVVDHPVLNRLRDQFGLVEVQS